MPLPSKMNRLFALALFALSAGCSSTPDVPDPLVEATAQLYLLGARAEIAGDVPDAVRDSVLAVHGYTQATFREKVDALIADPVAAETLYARVERRLDYYTARPAADSLAR